MLPARKGEMKNLWGKHKVCNHVTSSRTCTMLVLRKCFSTLDMQLCWVDIIANVITILPEIKCFSSYLENYPPSAPCKPTCTHVSEV